MSAGGEESILWAAESALFFAEKLRNVQTFSAETSFPSQILWAIIGPCRDPNQASLRNLCHALGSLDVGGQRTQSRHMAVRNTFEVIRYSGVVQYVPPELHRHVVTLR